MFIRFRTFLVIAILILSCLPVGAALAQGPYYPYGPPPSRDDYDRERRNEEREMRREERAREEERKREYKRQQEWQREQKKRDREERRAMQNWYNEQQWLLHNQRYFGGYVLQPHPGESYESFTRRVRQQCNQHWNRCATYCNTIRDPYARAACVTNCNTELYECQSRF